jgi:hypothetical protein
MVGSLKKDRLLKRIDGAIGYFLEEALEKGDCSFDSKGEELMIPESGTIPGSYTLKSRFEGLKDYFNIFK